MFDVPCCRERRSTPSAVLPPAAPTHRPAARSTIQISSALAKSERNTNCADWLPASSTCCSSGSRRINRARSVGRSLRAGRVLPCYTTAAVGVDRGTPIARCPPPPPPRASSCPSPRARRGSCACRTVTAVILTSHASRMKSDRRRPSAPLSRRRSTLRSGRTESSLLLLLLAAGGRPALPVR